MRLHYKGYAPLFITLVVLSCLVLIINILFPVQTAVHYILYGIGVAFYVLCIRFFRYPARVSATVPGIVLSAADGHVVVIEEITEDEYFHDKRKQVSVFMSPLNVHVNWYPISGEILYTKYHRGSHIPAYRPKASVKNERMFIVISKLYDLVADQHETVNQWSNPEYQAVKADLAVGLLDSYGAGGPESGTHRIQKTASHCTDP